MNMIIGKRQIILSALVLGLGIAVYLNWQYSRMDMPVTDGVQEHIPHYGEAQFVDAPAASASADDPLSEEEAFFAEAQLSRQRARDEAVETLAVMLADANLDSTQRTQLALRAVDLAESIETEGKIETLLRAKGFADVMVYYDTRRADVIIRTSGLLAQEASQIRDVILRETSVEPENISIVEIN